MDTNPNRQRLVVLFDGTWNDRTDITNVFRLANSLHDRDGEIRQRFFYDAGVGTGNWWNRLRGGLTGYGLDRNLCQGYEWLCRNYRDGDEIYLFGFSRGAYTARSLGGMIRKCGLLSITTPKLLEEATALYRDREQAPEEPACVRFRERHSRKADIHMIGVWDTVGALGVPGLVISRKKYAWHDTTLSKIVKRGYQAMALDEHREIFINVPWTTEDGQKKPGNLDIEQRWFIGAHANVGGGYGVDPLADITLEWMQQKAIAAGLKLDRVTVPDEPFMARPEDSFKDFAFGLYAIYRRIRYWGRARFHRLFAIGDRGMPAVNVTVDRSVWSRWTRDESYRPETLTSAEAAPPETLLDRDTEIA